LKATSPAKVSTYAYVNPVVAMILGWTLAEEPLTVRNILAAAIVLTAVILITTYQTKKKN
jgi:drug/metabolite transporter (DMT)-like permease